MDDNKRCIDSDYQHKPVRHDDGDSYCELHFEYFETVCDVDKTLKVDTWIKPSELLGLCRELIGGAE